MVFSKILLLSVLSIPFCGIALAQGKSDYVIDPKISNAWSRVQEPSSGSSHSIGSYVMGCLEGGVELPIDGPGYQVMHFDRNRNYGHPDLIQFLKDYGKKMKALHTEALIGDLSQARGGPLPFGHGSHQSGLDVDIWFWNPDLLGPPLDTHDRNGLKMKSVFNPNETLNPNKFSEVQISKLKIAAESNHVERVFVNADIKRYLCKKLPANDRSWLHVLRAWANHRDHFHVRLACPSDSSNCKSQPPQEEGDGCDELNPNWKPKHPAPKKKEYEMPKACFQVLHE